MRLFIAAEPPGSVLDALAETSALLRGSVQGRYVAPDSFHVTLAFLGDVDVARVDQVVDALEEGCCGIDAFDVLLGDLGSFGRRSKATLWQGFRDAGLLPEIAASVRRELDAYGLPFDGKTFLAHVTLMRSANLLAGVLPAPAISAGQIDTVTLFRSDLSGERPVYDVLHSVLLAAADKL